MARNAVLARWQRAWVQDSWVRPFLARYRRALLASLALGLLTMVFAAGLMFTSGFLISDAQLIKVCNDFNVEPNMEFLDDDSLI